MASLWQTQQGSKRGIAPKNALAHHTGRGRQGHDGQELKGKDMKDEVMKHKTQQVLLTRKALEAEAIQQVIDLILTGDDPRRIGSHLGAIEQGARLDVSGDGGFLIVQRRG